MPRLKDLLEYLTTPGLEDVWVLLDIKVPWPNMWELLRANRINEWAKFDNDADDIIRLIAADLAEVKPTKPWNQRVLLGCWAVSLPYILSNEVANSDLGQVFSSLLEISAKLSYCPYWIRYCIRTPISECPECGLQHASKYYGGTFWQ
jgi:hypothetical protein